MKQFNSVFSNIEDTNVQRLVEYHKNKLNGYVERISTEGGYIDNHNGATVNPSCIALLYNGEVCPIPACNTCLNPLVISGDGSLHLSQASTGAPNMDFDPSYETRIEKYNDYINNKCSLPSARYMIVAWYEF